VAQAHKPAELRGLKPLHDENPMRMQLVGQPQEKPAADSRDYRRRVTHHSNTSTTSTSLSCV
jgi:hypothetical protein